MRSLRLTSIVSIAFAVVALVAPSSPSRAGNWAVASFDELPDLEAGVPVEVGFTILQHGAHPATPETLGIDDSRDRTMGSSGRELMKGDEMVGVTAFVDGGTTFFPAEPSGAPGHYVATVEVPEPGVVSLRAEMSWFGSSDAFEVEIGAPDGSRGGIWPGAGDASGWPVLGIAAIGAACLAVVIIDLGGIRVRRGGGVARAR